MLHNYRVFTIPVYDGGRFIFANFNLFYSSENSVVMFATTVITNLYIYFPSSKYVGLTTYVGPNYLGFFYSKILSALNEFL